MTDGAQPISLGLREAVRITGLSRGVLYRLMESGELQSSKVAGRRLVIYSSLQGLIDQNMVQARAP